MNFLISGGSGYLGSQIISYLLKNNMKVVNCDIVNGINYKNENYKFIKCDITKFNKNILYENNIDKVIHCTAKVPITKNKKKFLDTNSYGTKKILDASLETEINSFVYVSSSAVYGIPDKTPITENDDRNPVEEYGLSKKLGEDECFKHMYKSKTNIKIIRPRTIMGGDRLGIFSMLFWWIKNNQPIPVLNDGNNLYQFIDIKDLVEVIYKCSLKNISGDFNIGSEKFNSIRDNISYLIEYANSKSIIKNINEKSFIFKTAKKVCEFGIIPLQKYHFEVYGKNVFFDIDKAKKEFNWVPRVSNYESFKESYDLFVNIDQKKTNYSPHKTVMKNFLLKKIKYFI